MNTKDIIFELRTKNGMSQDELAEKVFVTRQAVRTRKRSSCSLSYSTFPSTPCSVLRAV